MNEPQFQVYGYFNKLLEHSSKKGKNICAKKCSQYDMICTSDKVVPMARSEQNFETTRRCSDLYMGFSRRNKIPRCSAYDIGESNPVLASGDPTIIRIGLKS